MIEWSSLEWNRWMTSLQDYIWFKPACAVVIFIVAWMIQTRLRSQLLRLVDKHQLPSSLSIVIRLCLRWMIMLIAVLVSLKVFGVEFGNLWTLFSAVLAMVAVGFVAVWSILSNILSFFVILIWHHWELGDRISIVSDNVDGVVEDMDMIFTTIRADDGSCMNVPNNLLLQRVVRVHPKK